MQVNAVTPVPGASLAILEDLFAQGIPAVDPTVTSVCVGSGLSANNQFMANTSVANMRITSTKLRYSGTYLLSL